MIKRDSKAITPFKKRITDEGLDINITKISEVKENGIILYDTDLTLIPPFGYYLEISPRSSFGFSGYILTNSKGIIDKNYRGTIKVPLYKIIPTAPDLELPYRGFQLLLKKSYHCIIEEVKESEDNAVTTRGGNGFGSSG